MRYGSDVNKALAEKTSELRRSENDSLYEATRRLENDVESLYWKAESLKRRMEEVMERCKNANFDNPNFDGAFYVGVNSLGEVQGNGTEIDILCALVQRGVETMNREMHREKKAKK